MNSFYSTDELAQLGFASVGKNVLVSRKASIYGADKMYIGDNVRVDDFCILSGKIEIGNYVHIAAFSGLWGGNAGIYLRDFVNISSKNVIYAISDDYSGETMTNPMVSDEFKNVREEKVVLEKHVIIGSGSCILPGVTIETGTAVGSMSLVNRNLESWKICIGVPCRPMKDRKKDLLQLEKELLENY